MSNRVFLDSIGDKKSSNSSKSSKTVRFNLNLFEPTSNEFSQFNYSSLVRIEKVIMRKSVRVKSKRFVRLFDG